MNNILVGATGKNLGTVDDPTKLEAGQLALYGVVGGRTVNWKQGMEKPKMAWIALGLGGGKVRNSITFEPNLKALRLSKKAFLAARKQQRTIKVSYTGNEGAIGKGFGDEFMLRVTVIRRNDPTNSMPWNEQQYYAFGVFDTVAKLYEKLAAEITADASSEIKVVSQSADGLVIEPLEADATIEAGMTYTPDTPCQACYNFKATADITQELRYAVGDKAKVHAEEVAASYELGTIENWMSWVFPSPQAASVDGTDYNLWILQKTSIGQSDRVGFVEENMTQLYVPTTVAPATSQGDALETLLEELFGKNFS